MCMKECEFIKSGHTFGCLAVDVSNLQLLWTGNRKVLVIAMNLKPGPNDSHQDFKDESCTRVFINSQ